jgi:hypothetical protein
MKRYQASLGKLVLTTTVLVAVLLTAVTVTLISTIKGLPPAVMILITVSPLASFAIAFLYRVWGYGVSTHGIRVHRTLFPVTLPLQPPVTIERTPGLTKGSLRTFGNGGLFGFYGRFWKSGVGSYRAFVTDPANALLLTSGERKFALSPDQPDAFIRAVEEMAGRTK